MLIFSGGGVNASAGFLLLPHYAIVSSLRFVVDEISYIPSMDIKVYKTKLN